MQIPGAGKTIFPEEKIQARVKELAKQISDDYRDKHPVMVSVLKGPLYFVADLTRYMDITLSIDFMAIGVFAGSTGKTGIVRITKDLDIDITGRHVLMVEDVINTGLTASFLIQNLQGRKPASVKLCTLLNNDSMRLVNLPLDYVGFSIPDISLVGYGLDMNEDYRNLPYIAEYSEKMRHS